jgi:hypothetical protein
MMFFLFYLLAGGQLGFVYGSLDESNVPCFACLSSIGGELVSTTK